MLVLYNGYDSFGEPFSTEQELRNWYWSEEMGDAVLAEADYEEMGGGALAEADFYDKGYGFFRSCMDSGFAHDALVPLVRWMYQRGINDTRDIDYEDLRAWIAQNTPDEWDEALVIFIESDTEVLGIPDLMRELRRLPEPIAVVGGAREECLAEVLIALDALGKEYEVIEALTY
ncbi:hypothetical protein LCGC14_3032810 [marine sediment metagenome]|uniref:Uncharacterized protein n=1 Tax=marine sediment metagenome TaxID=412755 RepID=A0A0F8WRP4_9ZZZZ